MATVERRHSHGRLTNRRWTFRVKCTTNPGETVCVVGNTSILGDWNHEKAFALKPESDFNGHINGVHADDARETIWSASVVLPGHKIIKYRYFICMLEDNPRGEANKVHIIRRWETHLQPRRVSPGDDQENSPTFEVFGEHDGELKIEHGWLTHETVVQFKLSNCPLQLWKHRNLEDIRFKMVTIDLKKRASAAEINGDSNKSIPANTRATWPLTEISVLNEEDHEFRLQSQFGHSYRANEMVILQAQVLHLSSVAFKVDLYKENPGDVPVYVGFCYILPSTFKQSNGTMTLPVTSVRQDLIGQLTIEFLVIKPMPNCPCDMEVSFAQQWKANWKGLDVGHRGFGHSWKSCKASSSLRENTIASLSQAAECGADFVEFDVQLTKDLVPVLFHDFFVNLGLEQKSKLGGQMTTLTVPVKDLTAADLHKLKVFHLKDSNPNESEGDHFTDEHDPFPTLQHALEVITPHVGFNVEIKWTMQYKDGSWELENPIELNMFLDIVLQAVLEHAGARKIIFSCFHPDICTMIRYKQNKYPTMFLTQGITQRYPEYGDPRTHNIPIAILFAKSANLLGLCVHTEDVLRDPTQVQQILQHKLVVFCWGEENNDKNTLKYLKDLGMDGIIYDRIGDHIGEQKMNIFLVEDNNELMNIASKSSGVLSPGCSFDRSLDEDSVSRGLEYSSSTATLDSTSDQDPPTTFGNGRFFI